MKSLLFLLTLSTGMMGQTSTTQVFTTPEEANIYCMANPEGTARLLSSSKTWDCADNNRVVAWLLMQKIPVDVQTKSLVIVAPSHAVSTIDRPKSKEKK